jgi:hypothetical protein
MDAWLISAGRVPGAAAALEHACNETVTALMATAQPFTQQPRKVLHNLQGRKQQNIIMV